MSVNCITVKQEITKIIQNVFKVYSATSLIVKPCRKTSPQIPTIGIEQLMTFVSIYSRYLKKKIIQIGL